MELSGYSVETASGYSGLCQVFLTHSALEVLMSALGVKAVSKLDIFELDEAQRVINQMREADRKDAVMKYVCAEVRPKLRENLDGYFDGTLSNLGLLSAAIRHIFVHGKLTANKGASPKRVATMCNVLSESILETIDNTFSVRVENFISQEYGGSVDTLGSP